MPDLFDLLVRWWKQVLLVTLLSTAVVGTIVFLQPSQYLSVATAVLANPALSDKGRVFNEQIELLYPPMGTPEELDIVVGTGQLDTVYIALAPAFGLPDHYKVKEQGEAAVAKAAYLLKKNTQVSKSEYGELKVRVWDTDNRLAAQLANAVMNKLNAIHQELQNETNRITLKALIMQKSKLSARVDSALVHPKTNASLSGTLAGQLATYEKLIDEYQLIVDTKPAVLIVIDSARPASWPDRPRRLLIILATAFLAFLFGLAIALVMERRKKIAS